MFEKNEIVKAVKNYFDVSYSSRFDVGLFSHEEKVLGNVSNISILDLMCGYGRVSTVLAMRKNYVFGVDFSYLAVRNGVDLAKIYNVYQNVDYVVADVVKPPLRASKKFNLGLCLGNSLNHIPEPHDRELVVKYLVSHSEKCIIIVVEVTWKHYILFLINLPKRIFRKISGKPATWLRFGDGYLKRKINGHEYKIFNHKFRKSELVKMLKKLKIQNFQILKDKSNKLFIVLINF